MKYPAMERKYMWRKLIIRVRYEQPSMKCRVTYGLSSIDLPRHLDEVWGWLRWITDVDWSERRYGIIKKEVNDMLREYYLNYNCSGNLIWQDGIMAEQFNFPDAPIINTYAVQNGQIHIVTWATPTCVDRYTPWTYPYIEYLTSEDYEDKRNRGELESWTIYCVLN